MPFYEFSYTSKSSFATMTSMLNLRKNTVNNYTDIQCKVREATCNEPWGPATTVMTEIADATYSV